MKITGNSGISVNINPGREPGLLFKNIKPGDIISASVIRSEGNRAILEIGNTRITAEFTNGVPQEKIISLELTIKTPEMIKFAIKDNNFQGTFNKLFSDFLLYRAFDSGNSSVQNFARFINAERPDLAAINLFLLGIKKDDRTGKDISGIFNRLLNKGVPLHILVDLGNIIFTRHNPLLFIPYQFMLNNTGWKPEKNVKREPESIEESIAVFCDYIKEDDNDFSIMFDILFDENKERDVYGEIVFPDGEKFSRFEYIIYEDSIFLNFQLSCTGKVSVLIRGGSEQMLINFFPEEEDMLCLLKENDNLLKEMLKLKGIKKPLLGYFDPKKIVDKLQLWSLDFYTKSKFDIKI